MKAIFLEKNTKTGEYSFFSRYAEVPHSYNQFHYHKEYELIYNIENSGTRFIGDSIRRFENRDLVLVGPNIPHYWQSDDQYFVGDLDKKAKIAIVQFEENFLGGEFLNIPEANGIKNLFKRASQGIQIRGKDVFKIGDKIMQITQESGWKRLNLLIEVLSLMSEAEDYVLLASQGFSEAHQFDHEERISTIFHYIIKNYHQDISLSEAAEMANMNTTAFCRYLKKTTTKTFSQILNEIRIGFACKNLINSELLISQIAYDCGYMNIPYFNRQFRAIKNVSPQEYRQKHRK